MSEVFVYSTVLVGTTGLLTGLITGFIVSHRPLRNAFQTTFRSIARIRRKHGCAATFRLAEFDTKGVTADNPGRVKALDLKAVNGVRRLSEFIKVEYGEAVHTVYLFGSRARGDHVETSDVDIAIIFQSDVEDF
jgi:hypothetical protein